MELLTEDEIASRERENKIAAKNLRMKRPIKIGPGRISTFADCPYRFEVIKPEAVCYAHKGYCRLGARNTDYSICRHPDRKCGETIPQGTGDSNDDISNMYCEACTRAGVCPEGFGR